MITVGTRRVININPESIIAVSKPQEKNGEIEFYIFTEFHSLVCTFDKADDAFNDYTGLVELLEEG